jgi:coenzyme F420-reducing hydrogenase delta subunit
MINISSAMGNEFAQHAGEFTNEIVDLGPNPLTIVQGKEDEERIK